MDSFTSYIIHQAYEKVKGKGDKLAKIKQAVEWERFRPIIKAMYTNDTPRGGRPNVDEVHQKVSALWGMASIMIAVAAVLVGVIVAIRSSIAITPSLERRWRFDQKSVAYDDPWIIKMPLKLRKEQLDGFIDFMTKALNRYRDDPSLATSRIRTERRGDNALIRFVHKSVNSMVGDIYVKNVLLLNLGPGEEYSVSFESIGNDGMSHMSGSLVRLLALEWSTKMESNRTMVSRAVLTPKLG
jgi:hypothetical protein